jgi:hypothetical protein
MKTMTGMLRKLSATLTTPITYQCRIGDQCIPLSDALGKTLNITYEGVIHCIQCSRKTNKSFQQGFCYPCYRRLLECNMCMLHPERCRVEDGTCPKDDWAHAQCHQEQIVYLANSSGLKVGITRQSQVPTRWIDQGACQALPILKVNNRYQAGVVEVAMKAYVADKTNWRKMLKNEVSPIDLEAARDRLLAAVDLNPDKVEHLREKPVTLTYPVLEYPIKINSLSLDKQPEITGQLLGIKGQYVLLDHGVLNIRKFGGYEVSVSVTG